MTGSIIYSITGKFDLPVFVYSEAEAGASSEEFTQLGVSRRIPFLRFLSLETKEESEWTSLAMEMLA